MIFYGVKFIKDIMYCWRCFVGIGMIWVYFIFGDFVRGFFDVISIFIVIVDFDDFVD